MFDISEQQRLYDKEAKIVLAERSILANIMRYTIQEFKNYSVSYIAENCIEGTPNIGNAEVMPQIYGDNSEDNSPDGKVFFDVRFNAKIPDKETPVYVIINIEAQNDAYHGYPIVKRGIFYAGRLIVGQYGKVLQDEFDITLTPALEKGVSTLCNLSEGIWRRGYNEGAAFGIEQNQLANAANMLADNVPIAKIAQYTGLSQEKILDFATTRHKEQ